jgi:hypothetical protein
MNATVAAPITAVAVQPITFQVLEMQKGPMMRRLVDISINSTMTGTSTTPLMTAAQTSAFIEQVSERVQ